MPRADLSCFLALQNHICLLHRWPCRMQPLLTHLTNYRKLIILCSSLVWNSEGWIKLSSKYIFSLCWEMPLFQWIQETEYCFPSNSTNNIAGDCICYKRKMLSLCLFVKQPMANGQEAFQKVLQIHMMFPSTRVCIWIRFNQEKKRRGIHAAR